MFNFIILIFIIVIPSIVYANNITDIKMEREIKILEKLKINEKIKENNIVRNNNHDRTCIKNYNSIKLEGNTVYSEDKLYKKFVKYNSNCISKKDLQNIRDNINNFYITNGYVNCRVYFDITKYKDIILLVIQEGRINNVNGNSKLQILTAFPFKKEDRVFNIKEFDQGLDQMNRLQSNNIKLEIKPSDQEMIGYSDINLINYSQNKKSIFFGVVYDNGSGDEKINFNINKDNLLNINDNIYLSYSTTNFKINKKRDCYFDQIYVNISVPLGYYTMSFSYGNSKYKNRIIENDTDNFTYSLDRVIYRNNVYKNSITFELEDNNSKNYINSTLININSRKLYNIKVHFNNIFYLKNGIISVKPTFQKGIKNNKYKYSNYNLYKLFIYYSNRFNNLFTYSLNVNSQYTIENILYGENMFALGGNSTVRGYRNTILQSNSGFYIRNDFKINNPLYFIKRLQLNIFFDCGYSFGVNIKSNNIYGISIGFKYLGKYLNFEINYSKGLYPKHNKYNSDFLYFRVGLEI